MESIERSVRRGSLASEETACRKMNDDDVNQQSENVTERRLIVSVFRYSMCLTPLTK